MFNNNEYFLHSSKNFINIFSIKSSYYKIYYFLIVVFIIITENTTFAYENNSLSIYNNSNAFVEQQSSEDNQISWVIWKIIVILIASLLAIITGVGNLLVVQAFRINKQLRTISNYFLLSLAVADLTIGFISIPIYTAYFVANKWLLGPFICDLWLCIDVRLYYYIQFRLAQELL